MWTYKNELYHYGTLGMRWGHRKSISYYRKQLNSNDQKAVNALGKYMKLDVSGQLKTDKLYKYIKKHDVLPTYKNVAVLRKMRVKIDAIGEKRDSELVKLRVIDSDTHKLISDILSKGYSVTSKEVIRSSERGREAVTAVLAGTMGNIGSKVVIVTGKQIGRAHV